jgi:hypothetical protein
VIRNSDRRLAAMLVTLRVWRLVQPRDDLFRCPRVRPRWGTRWLWEWMKRRQKPDSRWHAPCCPANRWSGIELVFFPCTCAFRRAAKKATQ